MIMILSMAIVGFGNSDTQACAQEPAVSGMDAQENEIAFSMTEGSLGEGATECKGPICTGILGVRG
ncbi:hypothetical protein ACFL6Y_05290 [Elusimicrobiota bacterium]